MFRKKNREIQNEEITIRLESWCLKIVFIQYLFGIRSMRQTIKEIKASANKNKSKEVRVIKPIKQYQQELEAEINELRLADGKKKIVPAEPEESVKKKARQTPTAGFSSRGSTNAVLLTAPKQLAINTDLFWDLK